MPPPPLEPPKKRRKRVAPDAFRNAPNKSKLYEVDTVDKNGNPVTLEVGHFEASMIEDGEMVLSIGRKRTGKTTGLLDIMYEKRDVPEAILFCGTADTNPFYSEVIPDAMIYPAYDPEVLESVIARQEKINHERKKHGKEPKRIAVYIDDCGWDTKFCNDRQLKRSLMNNRWYQFSPLVVALQFSLGFQPALRDQFDWFVLHRSNTKSNIERLHEHFGGVCGSIEEFKLLFKLATEKPGGALVIRNSSTSSKLCDNVFFWQTKRRNWHEEPKQKRWRVGAKKFWRFNARHYDEEWRKADRQKVKLTAAEKRAETKKKVGAKFSTGTVKRVVKAPPPAAKRKR